VCGPHNGHQSRRQLTMWSEPARRAHSAKRPRLRLLAWCLLMSLAVSMLLTIGLNVLLRLL